MTKEVLQLHKASLVFLAYVVTPMRLTRSGADLAHMAQRIDGPQVDLPKLKEGGVDAVFLSLVSEIMRVDSPASPGWATRPPTKYLSPVFTGPAEVKRVLWGIDALHRMVDENRDVTEVALSASDVERIVAKGKIAAIIHVTPASIDDDLAVLRTYHRLGVRAMQLVYDFGAPTWADAGLHPPIANGLSEFGREVIREMNRLGMLIDLAHASDKAYADVVAISEKPVISSHSGARALCNHWRNLSDDTMREVAAKKGLVGAFFGSGYLDEDFAARKVEFLARQQPHLRHLELAERYADDPFALAAAIRDPAATVGVDAQSVSPPKSSPMSVLLDHIDHCIHIAGENHVCLGSDFGGIESDGVVGLDEPSKMPNLTAALLARGYSKEAARKILGTNLLRLFREVVGA